MTSWKEENFLTGLLFLAVICHGMFFGREWLIFGIVFIAAGLFYWSREIPAESLSAGVIPKLALVINRAKKILLNRPQAISRPVVFFVLMIILSLAGLFRPVRSAEGYLEAFRWLVFLTAFLWGKKLALHSGQREKVINRIIWLALIATILTWLPGNEVIWALPGPPAEGRFASSFGYPNAAAVFLGCQFILLLQKREPNLALLMVFGLSVISTGSRAAVALLIIFSGILGLKKIILKTRRRNSTAGSEGLLGFYKGAAWTQDLKGEAHSSVPLIRGFILIILLVLCQHSFFHCQGSLEHLLTWTDNSLKERIFYYVDSMKIAWGAYFLPQAGGWLAFPFIQTAAYWTLDPHSSLCRVLLNQGLPGTVLAIIWAANGLKAYLADLFQNKDLTVIGCKTAVLYLGLHSLIDVDMSFGALGILFWLLAGISSGTSQGRKQDNLSHDMNQQAKDE